MTRRLSREEIANSVFRCLAGGPASIEDGVGRTGLSRAQWRTGLHYIREVLNHNPDALLYDAATGRYSLDEDEVEAFITAHIRQFTIKLRHLYDGAFVPTGLKRRSLLIASYQACDLQVSELIEDLESTIGLSEPEARMAP